MRYSQMSASEGDDDDHDERDRHEADAGEQHVDEFDADRARRAAGAATGTMPCRMLYVASVAMIDDSFRPADQR